MRLLRCYITAARLMSLTGDINRYKSCTCDVKIVILHLEKMQTALCPVDFLPPLYSSKLSGLTPTTDEKTNTDSI